MTRLDTFLECLKHFAAHSFDNMSLYITDDFEMVFLPTSTGLPTVGKDGLPEMLAKMGTVFEEEAMKFIADKSYEAKEGDTLIVEAHANGVSKLGTPWHSEMIFIVEFSPDEKVKKITEFFDSGFVKDFHVEEAKKVAD
ncbi:hypothetical protein FPV67DRAFT_1451840 [Lyophyllum atratum]|nr:hypothetical protein FPV67DRAFT_1451840 [Lyophyllum atratum]